MAHEHYVGYMSDDRELNPEHVQQVIKLIEKSPYYNLLGMHITNISVGSCDMEVQVESKLLNSFGGIHGGAYASILDTVTYWSLYGDVDEDEGYATLDLNVNDLSSVGSGTIYAHGHAVRTGRHILLAEAEILDARGKIVATGVSKMFMAPEIQPISQMVKAMDPSCVLPPKFLVKPQINKHPHSAVKPGD